MTKGHDCIIPSRDNAAELIAVVKFSLKNKNIKSHKVLIEESLDDDSLLKGIYIPIKAA